MNQEKFIPLKHEDFRLLDKKIMNEYIKELHKDGLGYTYGTLEDINNDRLELFNNGFYDYDIEDYVTDGLNYCILTN